MNILHLKYAITVAEVGSISKAAEKLYIAQPNISRAIRDLEYELGITIFERTPKGIVTTTDGELLINYAKKIMKQLDELEHTFKDQIKKEIFSISVPRVSYISKAFVEFSKELQNMKNIELIYKETNANKVINNVLNEDYKLGIIRYASQYDHYFKELLDKKELNYELVNQDNCVIVCSKDSKLASIEKIDFNNLTEYTEISYADPYVPSIPISEINKSKINEDINKHIFVFDRASQLEILSSNPCAFMFVLPLPKETLERYNLVQKELCNFSKEYKDLLIYRASYKLSKLDLLFITKLCEEKRKVINQ